MNSIVEHNQTELQQLVNRIQVLLDGGNNAGDVGADNNPPLPPAPVRADHHPPPISKRQAMRRQIRTLWDAKYPGS